MNIKKGDILKWKYSTETAKVLAVVDELYALSNVVDHNVCNDWYTLEELKEKFIFPEDCHQNCACGLAWGHTGKHKSESILDRTVYAAPKVARWCEHGTDLHYFCEDCDGAKITKGLDEEAEKKKSVGYSHTMEEGVKNGCPSCVDIMGKIKCSLV